MKTNLTRLAILLLLSLTTLPTQTQAQWSGTGDIYYNNGNVGIGTDTPSGKLHVQGNIYIPHDQTLGAGTSTAVKMWGIRGQAGSNQRLELYDRVSIGYPSGWNGFPEPPIHGLYVHGSARIGNLSSRHYFTITSKEWPEVRFNSPSSSDNMRLGMAHVNNSGYGVEEGDLYIYSNQIGSMPFIIRESGDIIMNKSIGNVGIGTTTPDNKLDVKGTIRAEEVKVESTPWPDYVFSDTYQLNPLSEVSTYIRENHHLPGIPSAEEVAENGIKLGEMNAKLLEKVEELTLYLIEKDKEIINQSQVIEQLIGRIEKLENK